MLYRNNMFGDRGLYTGRGLYGHWDFPYYGGMYGGNYLDRRGYNRYPMDLHGMYGGPGYGPGYGGGLPPYGYLGKDHPYLGKDHPYLAEDLRRRQMGYPSFAADALGRPLSYDFMYGRFDPRAQNVDNDNLSSTGSKATGDDGSMNG